jgi:fatty-acyl-CoA synthase
VSATDLNPVPLITGFSKRQPDHPALVSEERSVTYAELLAETARMAAGLRAAGVSEGGRVGYLGLNSIELLVTYLATAWLGGVFVPMNFRLSPPEIADLIDDCGLAVLVADPALAAALDHAPGGLDVQHLVLSAPNDTQVFVHEWTPLADFIGSSDVAGPVIPRAEDDLAVLMYTSGTTGKPKGVMLTHGNIWWNQVNVDSSLDTRADDVNLAIAPLFHIGALNSFTLRTLTRGGTTLVRRGFDAASALEDIERFGVTTFFAVPTMFAQIAREARFADADLGTLRAVVVAAAPVPPSVIETWSARGVAVQQAWGLTETAPFATWVPLERTLDKLGSAGIPMPFTEVCVLDLETRTPVVEPGRSGELAVRGPNVVAGYWSNEAATRAAFTDDGWFLTGDIGYADDEGFIFIIDRLKDMIITGGENVYPAEVERVLAEHPMLVDNAIVGAADERWGEAVVAVVSIVDGMDVTLDEIREFCITRLARYKLPSRLVIIDRVPRNGSGKLDKVAIRAVVADQQKVSS